MITENGGVAVDFKCDVSKRDQVKDVHAQVKEHLGPVDILINNAGIVWGHSYFNPSKDQLITDIINVNLMGQFWVSCYNIRMTYGSGGGWFGSETDE